MRYQIWSDDVALARIRMVLVVQEMPRVPNNYVLTVHRVSTDESGDLCLCLRGRYLSPDDGNAIIDLLAVVPENPHVCDAVVIGRAIHRAGPDLVAGSTRFVHDTVSAADSRVALPLCFFDDGVPLQSGWAAACRNHHALHLKRVVGGAVDIEIETPVHVMLMPHARSRVSRARESKSCADRSVVSHSPVRHVSVPSRHHFADDT